MLHGILEEDYIQLHHPLVRHYTNFVTMLLISTLLPNLTFSLLREVSIEHLQRVRHANRGCLLLLTTWPVLLWDLHVFYCWNQNLLNLSCFRNFEFRTSLGSSFNLMAKVLKVTSMHMHTIIRCTKKVGMLVPNTCKPCMAMLFHIFDKSDFGDFLRKYHEVKSEHFVHYYSDRCSVIECPSPLLFHCWLAWN